LESFRAAWADERPIVATTDKILEWAEMNCLVTGGAGFIGSHLVEHLVRQGAKVRVMDNFSTGKRENLVGFLNCIDFIEADIADPHACARACKDMEVVFHQAALPSVPKSVADPITTHRTNVQGTLNLLMAAREAGIRRFIYAASSSAYGETVTLPKTESLLPQPLSPYAVQKLTGEHYCQAFAVCYGLQTLSFRYFNVFGPRQDPASQYAAAIPAFITSMLNDRPPTIYGDGEQTRDFTYVENVVNANLLAAAASDARGQVINIAAGHRVTVNEIVSEINKLLNKNIKPLHDPPRPGDIKHSWADITLASRVIGYRPTVSLAEGLRRTVEWYRGLSARPPTEETAGSSLPPDIAACSPDSR
jgi:UDP-glucose 4-epimerase